MALVGKERAEMRCIKKAWPTCLQKPTVYYFQMTASVTGLCDLVFFHPFINIISYFMLETAGLSSFYPSKFRSGDR